MADTEPPPRAVRLGLRAATALVRALGPARAPLAAGIGLSVYAADRRRRRRTARNHRRRRPDLDDRSARRLARRSYVEYARAITDFVWANGMSTEEVAERTRLRGFEHVEAALASGRGGVLTLTHFGNWDMAALIALSRGLSVTTVMAPIGTPLVTRTVVWARRRNRLEVFTPERAARGLLRALARGRMVAVLADIPGGGPECVVQYCGGPVVFSTVPAWLALRTGAHLLPVDCRRGGRGERDYVSTVHPAVVPRHGEDAASVMQRVALALEAAIDAAPGQWYPFGAVYADTPS